MASSVDLDLSQASRLVMFRLTYLPGATWNFTFPYPILVSIVSGSLALDVDADRIVVSRPVSVPGKAGTPSLGTGRAFARCFGGSNKGRVGEHEGCLTARGPYGMTKKGTVGRMTANSALTMIGTGVLNAFVVDTRGWWRCRPSRRAENRRRGLRLGPRM